MQRPCRIIFVVEISDANVFDVIPLGVGISDVLLQTFVGRYRAVGVVGVFNVAVRPNSKRYRSPIISCRATVMCSKSIFYCSSALRREVLIP